MKHPSHPDAGPAAGLQRKAQGLLILLLALRTTSGAIELSLGNAAGSPAGTVGVTVQLTSDIPIVGLQFDVAYPLASLGSDGAVASDPASGISLASREIEPGVRRVLVTARNSQPLSSGILAVLPFRIDPAAPSGTQSLRLRNALLSDPAFRAAAPVVLKDGGLTITSAASAQFTSFFFDTQGAFHLGLNAAAGSTHTLQVSPDLKVWTPFTSDRSVNGAIRFVDTNTVHSPSRFYRSILAP